MCISGFFLIIFIRIIFLSSVKVHSHTRVDLVSDAISIETLLSFQMAMAGDSDNM
jgi:hypothetical protein